MSVFIVTYLLPHGHEERVGGDDGHLYVFRAGGQLRHLFPGKAKGDRCQVRKREVSLRTCSTKVVVLSMHLRTWRYERALGRCMR